MIVISSQQDSNLLSSQTSHISLPSLVLTLLLEEVNYLARSIERPEKPAQYFVLGLTLLALNLLAELFNFHLQELVLTSQLIVGRLAHARLLVLRLRLGLHSASLRRSPHRNLTDRCGNLSLIWLLTLSLSCLALDNL